MKIFDCEQKSPEWWALRRGIPTASSFDKIITPAKGEPSASQDGLIDQLICERISHLYSEEPENAYISPSMQNGIECEPAARAWYAFDRNVEVRNVGICLSDDGRFGCSPDGLVGDEGGLEIKCCDLKTHVKYLRAGKLPNEYRCQVHGEIVVTGAKWWDFISYSPDDKLESVVIRVLPDEFTEKLRAELMRFLDKYDAAWQKLGVEDPCQRPF